MSSHIPLIPNFFIKLVENWADKRQTTTHNTATIDPRHLYILPSKSGLFFFFILLVIFIGAINYENNLAFLLCFLLASISVLCMIFTHLNIKNIQLNTNPPPAVFSGQTAYFPITLKHANTQSSMSFKIEADKNKNINIHTLKPNEDLTIQLPVKTQQRGYQSLPRIKIYTRYPLGLFYAWSWLKMTSKCLVYPAPTKKNHQLTNNTKYGKDNAIKKVSGEDEFKHLRDYQIGDSPAHIAWKSFARSRELLTKTFQSSNQNDIWIDWFNLQEYLSIEEKLSILCRQVIDASQEGLAYGLKLPNQTVNCGTDAQHRHHCLAALALFSQ